MAAVPTSAARTLRAPASWSALDGHIVTNHHVIEGATELQVQVGNRLYKATVKGDDPATDLALIKIEPEGKIPYLQLADSDKLRVGDWILVIGSPLRLQNSVSVGVVSAKGRSINITAEPSLENFIQTDAAINFGNSGGPLVNLKGEVVGIATAINAGAESIGFAVPANTLAAILPQLRDSGKVSRGYLGVNIDDLDFEEAQAFGLPDTEGTLVTRVIGDGPGEKAGLQNGDILLQVDARKIKFNRDLIDYVALQPPGTTVTLKVFRNGKTFEKATLGERPASGGADEEAPATSPHEDSSVEFLGLQMQDVTKPLREAHGIPAELNGVWITGVEPDSPLYERNVRPNDVLVDLNGEKIGGTKDLQKQIGTVKSGGYLRFYVGRFSRRPARSASSTRSPASPDAGRQERGWKPGRSARTAPGFPLTAGCRRLVSSRNRVGVLLRLRDPLPAAAAAFLPGRVFPERAALRRGRRPRAGSGGGPAASERPGGDPRAAGPADLPGPFPDDRDGRQRGGAGPRPANLRAFLFQAGLALRLPDRALRRRDGGGDAGLPDRRRGPGRQRLHALGGSGAPGSLPAGALRLRSRAAGPADASRGRRGLLRPGELDPQHDRRLPRSGRFLRRQRSRRAGGLPAWDPVDRAIARSLRHHRPAGRPRICDRRRAERLDSGGRRNAAAGTGSSGSRWGSPPWAWR